MFVVNELERRSEGFFDAKSSGGVLRSVFNPSVQGWGI